MLPIVSFGDAMVLRAFRNEARRFMTRDQKPIGWLKQWRWFRNVHGKSMWAYLLRTPEAVGYGLLRCEKDHVLPTRIRPWQHWVSGAVAAERRGLGFGRQIFSFMTAVGLEHAEKCTGRRQVWLEVWKSNVRARKLYESLGYREVCRTDPVDGPIVITMAWWVGTKDDLYRRSESHAESR